MSANCTLPGELSPCENLVLLSTIILLWGNWPSLD